MRHHSSGFSVLELTIVTLTSLILSSFFLLGFKQARAMFSANSAEEIVSGKLRQVRSMAMTQRKNMKITFINPNQLQVSVQTSRQEFKRLEGEDVALPQGVVFNDGVGGTSPDGIALDSLRGTSFLFFGDGSAHKTDRDATLINGVIYLTGTTSLDQNIQSAVTVLGPTGRVRAYHYDSASMQWF